jgi:hypothetical protein
LNVPNNPKKHWFDGVGCEMIDLMHEQMFKKIQSLGLGQILSL